jgi:hypothetical protein
MSKSGSRWQYIASGLVLAVLVALGLPWHRSVDGASPIRLPDPVSTYDPATSGDSLPAGFRQLLDRDQIAPIYDPSFTTPNGVDWPDDMLVVGVAGLEEAKAYPVVQLNQREMIIDSLEGIPILVTW